MSELPFLDNFFWHWQGEQLQLCPKDDKRGGALFVDLDEQYRAYQKEQMGIKQNISKACGLTANLKPSIMDATAGLLGDAFLLAYLGASVCAIEQNAAVYALANNALNCATNHAASRLQLQQAKAVDYLQQTHNSYDVVYLDPMFPERKKAAKVKKSMQYLHEIVGIAQMLDEKTLFETAFEKAQKRVVVKRPRLASLLVDKKPNHQIVGKTVRFDVYLKL